MGDFYPREGEAICKVCAMPHPIDQWRGVQYYYCPESERVYLVNKKEEQNGNGHK